MCLRFVLAQKRVLIVSIVGDFEHSLIFCLADFFHAGLLGAFFGKSLEIAWLKRSGNDDEGRLAIVASENGHFAPVFFHRALGQGPAEGQAQREAVCLVDFGACRARNKLNCQAKSYEYRKDQREGMCCLQHCFCLGGLEVSDQTGRLDAAIESCETQNNLDDDIEEEQDRTRLRQHKTVENE